MAGFLDVPAFDGPGLFSSAADAAGQLVGSKKRKKAARPPAGPPGIQPSPAKKPRHGAGSGAGTRGRHEAGGWPGSGLGGAAAKPSSKAAGLAAATAEAAEAHVSGKNLGRRRRANEKRLREREARRDGSLVSPSRERPAPAPKRPAAAPAVSEADTARAAKKAALQAKRAAQRAGGAAAIDVPSAPTPKASKGPLSVLQRAELQLRGGRFRWLNEQLYTRTGAAAAALMAADAGAFGEYHAGFRAQTAGWARQPLDACLAWLARCPAAWEVADFGCGDARLAARATQKVHSFDLVATTPGVIACDICAGPGAVPLPDGAVQAAVFCLSLMGTDYGRALAEAHRVLAHRGTLWVAEVRSRFEGAAGGVDAFLRALDRAGFQLKARDESDALFATFRLQRRDGDALATVDWPVLKACEYKKR